MTRQRRVTKVAQSATATWQKPCHFSVLVGQETFFKQKKNCMDVFQFFLFLQRRKPKPTQIIGTKIIF